MPVEENNVQSSTVGQALGNTQQYTAPKVWEELTDSEKIERMREIVHSLQSQIYDLRSKSDKNRTELFNHRHDAHGDVLQKMNQYDTPMGLSGLAKTLANSKQVYF